MTDSLALERYAATQDAEAFAHLVQRYGQMVYATCLRTLRHVDDAEDASQDTFVQLAKSAGEVRSSLGAWLHRTAVNVSISRLRSDSRRKKREADAAKPPRVDAAAADVEWAEIRDVVDEVLAEMPEDERGLIVQRYLVGRTQVDLAAEHGVSASMMSRKVNAAVEELRARLRKRGVVAAAGSTALLSGLTAEAAVPVSAGLTARLVGPGLAGVPLAVSGGAAAGVIGGLGALPIKLSTAVFGSLAIHGLILGAYLLVLGRDAPSPMPAPVAGVVAPTSDESASESASPDPIRVKSTEEVAPAPVDTEATPGFVYLMGDTSKSGAYMLPEDGGLTLLELLATAGVVDELRGREVHLMRRDAAGNHEPLQVLRWDDPATSVARTLKLRAHDIVNLPSRGPAVTVQTVTLFDIDESDAEAPVGLDFETGRALPFPAGVVQKGLPAIYRFFAAEGIDVLVEVASNGGDTTLIFDPGLDQEQNQQQRVGPLPFHGKTTTADGSIIGFTVDAIDAAAKSITLRYTVRGARDAAASAQPSVIDPDLTGVWEFMAEDIGGRPAPSAMNASMWKTRCEFVGDTLQVTSADGLTSLLWRLERNAEDPVEGDWVQTLIEVEGDHDMAVGSEMLFFLNGWRIDGDRVNFERSVIDPADDEWKPVPAGHFDANGHRLFLRRAVGDS